MEWWNFNDLKGGTALEKSPGNSFAVSPRYLRANCYYKQGIDTKIDLNNETRSTAFNAQSKNVQSLLGRKNPK